MRPIFLLVAALAPVAFMLHFVYVRDKYEREPLSHVLRVFFLSFLTVIPAVVLEGLAMAAVDASQPFAILRIALIAFGVAGLIEESIKFLFLYWLAFRRSEFNEPYDGILYAVAVSLGFAAVENIGYVFAASAFIEQAATAVLRALLAVPGHALWGVMMGYFVGRAKFATDPGERRRLLRLGLLLPIFMHGLYDFFAFAAGEQIGGENLAMVFALSLVLVVAASWVLGVRMIRDAQAQSPFKRPSILVSPIGALNPHWKYCTRCGARALRTDRFCRQCGATWPARAGHAEPTAGR